MKEVRKMYYDPNMYRYPQSNYPVAPMYYPNVNQSVYWTYPNDMVEANSYGYVNLPNNQRVTLNDHGKRPYVVNINQAAKQNNNYRTAIWTGRHLQVTLMSINVGEDIGLEVHPTTDQFLRIEEGQGIVRMGDRKDRLDFEERVFDDFAIMVPAGKWHNVINTGNKPLKLYSIYGPPNHPFGTVNKTKAEAMHHHRSF